MKIPEEFKLGGVKWKVITKSMDGGLLGTCDSETAVIYVEKNLSRQMQEVTFCHELIHAIMFSMGMQDHDEKFVEGSAVFLHQYLTQRK